MFEDAFEPSAGSGISAYLHIQMIAVPVQMVADERGSGVLYGSARRDDNLYLVHLSRFLHSIGNGLIHGQLIAVIVFVIGRKIVKFALKITKKTMERKDVEISVQKFVMSLATFAYNIFLIIIIASVLGIGASSIVAIIGSAGLAVGLALQGSLSNLAGGVLILLLKPFKVGDYIISAGAEGTVQSIDIFYTRIATTDNKVVVIPNGTISNSNVTNTTKQDERMLVLDFTVGLNTDIAEVREKIMKLFEADDRILHDMNKCVVVDKLTPVNIKMQAKAWTKSEDYWDVKYLLLEQISIVLQGFR